MISGIRILILLGMFSFVLISCNKENNELAQTIEINNNIIVSTPDGFILEPLIGTDSYVARIVNPSDSSFLIFIDIGQLAGLYVDPDESGAQSGRSVTAQFVYNIQEREYLAGDDCCIFITFPDLGPANFVSYDNQHIDLVLDIMRTLRTP